MKNFNVLSEKWFALLLLACIVTGCKDPSIQPSDSKLKSEASAAAASNIISNVDTGLNGSQKFVLRVGGKPYFMNSIQVRLDKLRYFSTFAWSWTQCDALVGQAASDGFNTLGIPIQWYEVETSKNVFNWTILDKYLSMVNKYNVKMELLWFGANSTGNVGLLGDETGPGHHLRTPDYVLYSPKPKTSTATTSDYKIDRAYGDYTLDITDTNLRARETYVLGQVMAHIASWDAANGLRHPVVGVQLNNEFRGGSHDSAGNCVAYLNAIGSAVKNSAYVVWTRFNGIHDAAKITAKINANEALRSGAGTNIDFIGIDDYSNSQTDIQSVQPTIGKNFKMIMENGGKNHAQVRLAALAGNTTLSTYNMAGPDAGEQLYNQTSSGGFTPRGDYINDIRLVNHMLNNDMADIALNKQGSGLYVHNWEANSTSPSTGGSLSITYTPAYTSDIGISVKRSSTEIVLMSIGGGKFSYSSSLKVNGASKGYFDSNNEWVNQGSVSFTSTSVTPSKGTNVRLTYGSGSSDGGGGGSGGGSGTAPSVVGAGLAKAGTGAITPALPSGLQTGDILLMFVETAKEATSVSDQNGGAWAAVAGSPESTGTAAGTDGVRLTVFWSRYNGSQGAPTVSDAGDHQLAKIMAVRGAVATGNPWDVTAGDVDTFTDHGAAIPGATTTVPNTLVVVAVAGATPDATGNTNFSAWTNADLSGLAEVGDNTTLEGNGGALGLAAGVKTTAGDYGTTLTTLETSAKKGMMSIAIKPQ